MKKNNEKFALLLIFASIMFVSCDMAKQKSVSQSRESDPVSIINETSSSQISDFTAKVSITEKNSRIAFSEKLVNEYQVSTKIIGNNIFSRIDFNEKDGQYRSVISSNSETILFDRQNGDVLERVINDSSEESFEVSTLFSRVDLDMVKDYYGRLSYKITENSENNLLKIETPTELLKDVTLNDSQLNTEIIYYDLAMSVPVKEIYETVSADNVKIEIVIETTYQEIDGIPVKVGTVETKSYDFPYQNDVSEWVFPIIESEDEIEEISEEEFEELDKSQLYAQDVIIGDPADPDYTTTTVTTYEDVQLNSLSESFFRISL